MVEVGMSDAVCAPLLLSAGEHPQGPFSYRLEPLEGSSGVGWRFHHDPRGSFGGMDFYETPARRSTIEAAHLRLSTSPESPFVRLLSVGHRDLTGAEVLRGRVLIEWDADGCRMVEFDDPKAWLDLLDRRFGLPLDQMTTADGEALWGRVCEAHAGWLEAQSRGVQTA
jgi:N-hydroxyarylamine O-acetyltransferase